MARSEAELVGVQQVILRKEGRELVRGSMFKGFRNKWKVVLNSGGVQNGFLQFNTYKVTKY